MEDETGAASELGREAKGWSECKLNDWTEWSWFSNRSQKLNMAVHFKSFGFDLYMTMDILQRSFRVTNNWQSGVYVLVYWFS